MALPEIIENIWYKTTYLPSPTNNWEQIKQGFHDFWDNKWLSFRSGVIGGVVGLLPGIGGPIVDWLAYGQTVASNKNETTQFGDGNVKGVIGPEGATLAQKATAYVPTVLFGIPAAPFEAVVMTLLAYVGLDLGSPKLLTNHLFFDALSFGFMASMFLTFLISIWFIKYATLITRLPFRYWAFPLIALITWSCVDYTGGWEDYAILMIMTGVGLLLKYLKISRISFIIGFVLAHKLELITGQFMSLYQFSDLLHRPISMTLIAFSVIIVIYGIFFNKTTIKYT
jgi:TctA family transporter